VAIEGRFGSDIDRLISEIEEQKPDFVICDHRLAPKQLASFTGLEVVERLIQRQLPAMLLTTYQDPERIALRMARQRVPVIRGRDAFKIEDVSSLHDVVRREIAHEPVLSRVPHRVLLRVAAVRPEEVDVVVPSWRPDHAVVLPKQLMPNDIAKDVRAGDYVVGNVNIGAADEDDLYFADLNEIIRDPEDLK
jgi:CheY-like chemotaxis protein